MDNFSDSENSLQECDIPDLEREKPLSVKSYETSSRRSRQLVLGKGKIKDFASLKD